MGDLLFAIANLARKLGIEPESALRKANHKFSERFQQLEQHLEAQGRSVHDASLEEMEEIWQVVKRKTANDRSRHVTHPHHDREDHETRWATH